LKQVLVTGGAGFIGSHLVEELVRRGTRVTILDNFSTGRRQNLAAVLKRVKILRGDIRNPHTLRAAAKGKDLIYHLAAVSSVPLSVDDPVSTWDTNVQATCHMLEAARRAGVTRVVFISSASVYGAARTVPFRETLPLAGSSPYATSKLLGEQLCDLYRRLYGLETVCTRLFSVYGPRQNPRSQYANVIPAFATHLLAGRTPTVYGTGRQTRDFVFVKDVVRALVMAARARNVVGEVINVGSGVQVSVNALLAAIQAELGTRIPPRRAPKKAGDDPRTCADTRKALRLLGFATRTPFATGLRHTLDYFRANP